MAPAIRAIGPPRGLEALRQKSASPRTPGLTRVSLDIEMNRMGDSQALKECIDTLADTEAIAPTRIRARRYLAHLMPEARNYYLLAPRAGNESIISQLKQALIK